MAVDEDNYREYQDYGRHSDVSRRLERHEDRVRDAHTNAHLARWLALLALVLSAIALWASLVALNKATDALNLTNRNDTRIDRIENR